MDMANDIYIPDIAVLSRARKIYVSALLFEAVGRGLLHREPTMRNAQYVSILGRETIQAETTYRAAGGRLSGADLLAEHRGVQRSFE